jgi:hypothetical protein
MLKNCSIADPGPRATTLYRRYPTCSIVAESDKVYDTSVLTDEDRKFLKESGRIFATLSDRSKSA